MPEFILKKGVTDTIRFAAVDTATPNLFISGADYGTQLGWWSTGDAWATVTLTGTEIFNSGIYFMEIPSAISDAGGSDAAMLDIVVYDVAETAATSHISIRFFTQDIDDASDFNAAGDDVNVGTFTDYAITATSFATDAITADVLEATALAEIADAVWLEDVSAHQSKDSSRAAEYLAMAKFAVANKRAVTAGGVETIYNDSDVAYASATYGTIGGRPYIPGNDEAAQRTRYTTP